MILDMKHDFLILGASGMQGQIVTRDLMERGYRVFGSARRRPGLLALKQRFPRLNTAILDLQNVSSVIRKIKQVRPQVVINCAEGDWNLNVYAAALEAKTHVIDLGSDIPMTKDQLGMHGDFERTKLTAITGCGSTPGINNVALRHAAQFFDTIQKIEAGFAWTSNKKVFVVPFSMQSVIEEFTEPAPVIKNGKWTNKEPMSTVQMRKFRIVGKQKCFLVRHPETYSFFEYFKKQGVNDILFYAGFPDHSFEVIRQTIKNTDFAKKVVRIPGEGEIPLDQISRFMQEMYPKPVGYIERENLWVTIVGKKNGQPKTITMECLVPTLRGWEEAGCNIDTGLPASIIAQMILRKEIDARGSFAPEAVVPPRSFFEALRKRRMKVYLNGKRINRRFLGIF